MLKRELDATRINQVVNHPEVYKWVHGAHEGPLDISPLVYDRRNVLLMGEHGGVLYTQHQPGLYEGHSQVLPEGRGDWALDMARESIAYMFGHTDAIELFTRVPKGNLGARALTRAIHGSFQFRREGGWVIDGQPVFTDLYSLTVQDWTKTAEGLTEKGEWFHNRIDEEFAARGVKAPDHVDSNTVHNRYVGAAVEMIMGGQPHKAAVLYNRWAAMAGYSGIQIVTEKPLVLDVGDGVMVAVRNNDFWMMTCRLE